MAMPLQIILFMPLYESCCILPMQGGTSQGCSQDQEGDPVWQPAQQAGKCARLWQQQGCQHSQGWRLTA